MSLEVPSDEGSKIADSCAAQAEFNTERTLEHIRDAYGEAVEMQIRETIKIEKLNPETVDDIMAMITDACNVVFASFFAGMAAAEENPIVGEPIDNKYYR